MTREVRAVEAALGPGSARRGVDARVHVLLPLDDRNDLVLLGVAQLERVHLFSGVGDRERRPGA